MVSKLLNQLLGQVGRFWQIFVINCTLFLSLRIFEIIHLHLGRTLVISDVLVSLTGYAYDVLSFGVLSTLVLSIYLLLSTANKRLATVVAYLLYFLFLIISVGLTLYFSSNFIPLDHQFYAYTIADNIHIVDEYSDYSYWHLVPLICCGFVVVILSRTLQIKTSRNKALILLGFLMVCSFLMNKIVPSQDDFPNNRAYVLAVNKLSFFSSKSFDYFNSQEHQEVNSEIIEAFQKNNSSNEYLSNEYPLLKVMDKKNVLGPFFQKTDVPPNVVFIAVESLSSYFSGPNCKNSFTPFLDSLADHSLYWSSFLSNAARTYGVLPNTLGSLPVSNGFMDLPKYRQPYHLSLMSVLKQNSDYETSFYYGGWSGFDNMKSFLESQYIDHVFDKDNLEGLESIPKDDQGKLWGITDKELFRKNLADKKARNDTAPFFDYLLTLSIHSPFTTANTDDYQTRYDKKVIDLGLQEEPVYDKFARLFKCVMYTDDALKTYFDKRILQPDHENTIYVIFGDHRSGLVAGRNGLDCFHVPLIIYSPLLNRTKRMDAVTTHSSLPSSFSALLKGNFGVNYPNRNTFIAGQLDTVSSFQTKFSSPFSDYGRGIEYMHNGIHVFEGTHWQVKKGINEERVDSSKKEAIAAEIAFETYKRIDHYVCTKNKIYPFKEYIQDLKLNLLYSEGVELMQDYIVPENKEFFFFDGFENVKVPSSSYLGYNISFKIKLENLKTAPMFVIKVDYKDGTNFNDHCTVNEFVENKDTLNGYVQFNKRCIAPINANLIGDNQKLGVYLWNNQHVNCEIKDLKMQFWVP